MIRWSLVDGKEYPLLSDCITLRSDLIRFGLKLDFNNTVIACECMPWYSRQRVHEIKSIFIFVIWWKARKRVKELNGEIEMKTLKRITETEEEKEDVALKQINQANG